MAKQQTEIDIGGIKFKGGRVFLIITILTSFVGVLWGGFEAYQRYLDMEAKINSFVSPDLSGFDKKLEVVNTEVDMLQSEIAIILEEVSLVADVAKDLKSDMKLDLRAMDMQRRNAEFQQSELRKEDEFEEKIDLEKMKREDQEEQAKERIRGAGDKLRISATKLGADIVRGNRNGG